MHDIDRTDLEYEAGEFEAGEYEYGVGFEPFGGGSGQTALSETDEMEMASNLLGVTNDQELEHFLGSLIHKVGGAIGKIIPANVRSAVGGYLKAAAKQALPILGKAVGTYFGGPAGGAIGGQLASKAGSIFGLELEGLAPEEQEFEAARAFTRFAAKTVQNAASASPTTPPLVAARAAVTAAAQQHAPGLLPSGHPPVTGIPGAPAARPTPWGSAPGAPGTHLHRGTWIRRGRKIILLGV